MVYSMMKRLIEAAKKNGTIQEKRAGYIEKLNAFYMNDQITEDQYNELMSLVKEDADNG